MNIDEQTVLAKASYEKAKEVEASAKAAYESLKASQEPVSKAFEEAKKAYDSLKPALNLAKAQVQKAAAEVTIARAQYAALAPKEVAAENKRGVSNAKLLEAVKVVLTGKPDGVNNSDIYDGVIAQGIEMAGEKARENFNSYLSRWGGAGAGILVNKGTGRWALPTGDAPALPAGLVPAGNVEAPPSGLSLPPGLTPAEHALTEEFPGYEPLKAAGFTTRESLSGKTAEDLTAIAGIGAKTATKILEALVA